MPRYDFKRIEPKWQDYWKLNETFKVDSFEPGREKLYALDMFPYPSGSGLHVGHPEGYTATDIVCRYSRNLGKQVLHPMGWDAFGLPAEEYAIKTQTHPARHNLQEHRRVSATASDARIQLRLEPRVRDDGRRLLPLDSVDLPPTLRHLVRTPATDGPERTASNGPAKADRSPSCQSPTTYRPAAKKPCGGIRIRSGSLTSMKLRSTGAPALGTVLANEEIVDGKSERGDHPVERFPLRQWMLRITSYGDRLISELDDLNWSESIKDMQRNWIGRSNRCGSRLLHRKRRRQRR